LGPLAGSARGNRSTVPLVVPLRPPERTHTSCATHAVYTAPPRHHRRGLQCQEGFAELLLARARVWTSQLGGRLVSEGVDRSPRPGPRGIRRDARPIRGSVTRRSERRQIRLDGGSLSPVLRSPWSGPAQGSCLARGDLRLPRKEGASLLRPPCNPFAIRHDSMKP